jgi:hypothetical protein
MRSFWRSVRAQDKKNIPKDKTYEVFFKNGTPDGYIDIDADLSKFSTFEEAYNQFVFDLTLENAKSLKLVLSCYFLPG